LVSTCSTSTYPDFVQELDKWALKNKGCGRCFSDGVIQQSLGRRLLLSVALTGHTDANKKIDALVMIYGVDVNFDGDEDLSTHMAQPPTRLQGVLALSVFANKPESVCALLSHGADPNARFHMWGENTFVHAARNNYVDIVKMMFNHGANIWQTDCMGETAVVMAVKEANVELVNFFLKEGQYPNWFGYEDTMTLLHHAVESRKKQSPEVIRLLLAAGANPHHRCFRPAIADCGQVAQGYTPIQFLNNLEKGVSRWKEFTEEELPIVSLNTSILAAHMDKDCSEWRLAVCMSTHERLGADPNCMMGMISGEPSLLKLILDNVLQNDPEAPHVPGLSTEVYAGDSVSALPVLSLEV
jgi:hypothetical protein